MPYETKPMPFDPKSIRGISEKVLVSHYENNYVGAVKRLNAIGTQLAELDFAKATRGRMRRRARLAGGSAGRRSCAGRTWSGGVTSLASMATPSSRPCDWTGGSVYTTKDGKFFQVIVDDVTGKITKVKPISEGKDLSHAKSQKAAMDLAKMKLADAASKSMGQAKGPLGMCASSVSCLS